MPKALKTRRVNGISSSSIPNSDAGEDQCLISKAVRQVERIFSYSDSYLFRPSVD